MLKRGLWVALLFCATIYIFFGMGAGKNYGELWGSRLYCIVLACLEMICMYVIGRCILWCCGKKVCNGIDKLFIFVVGTFCFIYFVYLIGTWGKLSREICVVFILSIIIVGWRFSLELLQSVWHFLCMFWQKGSWEKFVVCVICALSVVNLLIIFLPPLDYDVLEYHLGTPAEYMKIGRIFFMENNVFAGFPQNLESIAFFNMQLLGRDLGALSSHIVLWLYGFLCLGALFCICRQFQEENIASTVLLLSYCLPWTSELLRVYYVEVPQLFCLLVALLCSLKRRRYFFWAGISLGIAIGFKYTALFFGVVSFIPFVWERDIKNVGKNIAWSLLGLFISYFPWAMRGYIYTGNIFFPLWQLLVNSSYWTLWMYERFRQATYHSGNNIFSILGEVFLWGRNCSFWHVFLLFPSLWILWKKFRSLWFISTIWIVLWLVFTHRIDRFIYFILILLCIPMAYVWKYEVQKIKGHIVLTIFLCIVTCYQSILLTLPKGYDCALGFCNQEQYLQHHHVLYDVEQFLNKNIDLPVLFVGEARTFYFDGSIYASTVFNRNFFEEVLQSSKTDQEARLFFKKSNIYYFYVNLNEIQRLDNNYKFIFQGKTYKGYFPWITYERVHQFFQSQCIILYEKKGHIIYQLKV